MHSLESFVHPSKSLGNTSYDYNKLKQSFSQLKVFPNKTFNLTEVGFILDQDSYELQKALDQKIGTRSELVGVLTELEWVFNGAIRDKKGQNVSHFAFTEEAKMAEKHFILGRHRNLSFQNKRRPFVKERATNSEVHRDHDKFYSKRYEMGILWSESNLLNNYGAASGQLYSLERRLQRDPTFEELYQQSVDADIQKRFKKILGKWEVKALSERNGSCHTIQ